MKSCRWLNSSMKTPILAKVFALATGLCVVSLPGLAPAKTPALQYHFTVGETNVYAVEITVQGENGQQVTSGNIFIATSELSSNVATLTWHSNLHTENRQPFQPGMGYYGGPYMGPMNGFPRSAQIMLDTHGQVLRSSGDYSLTVPLGELVTTLYPPLPLQAGKAEEVRDEALVMDSPQLLGPIQAPPSPSPYGGGFYMGNEFRNRPATLAVARGTRWQVLSNTPAALTLEKHTTLTSLLGHGTQPRLSAQAEARLEFNPTSGRFENQTGTAGLVSVTETTSRQSKIQFKFRRLSGDELAAALVPPPPPVVKPLTEAEIQKLVTDLKADDDATRRDAMSRLNGATVTNAPAELLNLLAGATSETDSFTRMCAMNFLASHATTEQVPTLLKLLRDSDMSIRQNVVKALARLHDPRAIEPLVDLVARGGSFNQEAINALGGQGAAAEKAVLTLFSERATETRQHACEILQKIGTHDSLETLQKQMADPDQSLSQAAVEAVRAINARQ